MSSNSLHKHTGPLSVALTVNQTNATQSIEPMDVAHHEDLNKRSFTDLLYLLLWKNTRFVGAKFIIKICCPCILLIIVCCASIASNTYNINCATETSNDCPDIYYQTSVSLNKSSVGHTLGSQLCADNTNVGYLGLIPHPSLSNNISLYLALIDELNKNIDFNDYHPLYNTSCKSILKSLTFTKNSLLKFFNSTNEFNEYINDADYGSSDQNRRKWIALLITFNDINGFDYTISVNESNSYPVDTNTIVDEYEYDVQVLFNRSTMSYINNGFVIFQGWIENCIINLIRNNTNINETVPNDYLWNYFIYPSTKYERNQFWTIFVYQMPTLVMFMFMFEVSEVMTNLIGEKVEGIRESLRIMGATHFSYWMSWFIWNSIEVTLISIGICIFGKFIGVVFSNTNILILFLYFWGFGLSQNAFFSLLTVFISNLKLGGFIAGFGSFLLNFSALYIMQMVDITAKKWLCLIPNAAFFGGINYIAQMEKYEIGYHWDNINVTTGDEEVTMSFIIGMLYIDTVLYTLLTVYCDNIVPSKFGQQKKWNYICTDCCMNKKNGTGRSMLSKDVVHIEPYYGKNYEETNANYIPYFAIRDVEKVFKSKNKIVCAVNGVNLDLNKGEVFCLLGHNGAGKTTLISILTGLMNATKGTAYINGYDLNVDMDIIRRWIGLCPQKDILWPTMTARQHLWLYARLKGVTKESVDQEIDKIMVDVGINDSEFGKKHADKLSGGQKRKLCLAIALIGGSEIVFLDEPTSGMDPQNRRLVWDLIEREKQNRCIILTTHYMEEADTLGDKIAIMSHGKIECCGSNLYLKNIYDVGYMFTISMKSDADDNNKELMDNCILNEIKDSKCVSYTNNEITYQLPFEESAKFSPLFKQLDERKTELNVNNYGLSMTTLEEVFLKVDNTIDLEEKEKDASLFDDEPTFEVENKSKWNIFYLHIYAILFKTIKWQKRDWNTIFWRVFYPPFLTFLTITVMYYSNPTGNDSPPKLDLNTGIYYDDSSTNIIPISDGTFDLEWINAYNNELSSNGKLQFGGIDPIDDTFPTKTFQSFLYSNKDKWDNGVISYGSFFRNPLKESNNIYLGLNASSYHSLPIMINLYNNWILNTFYTRNTMIKLSNFPMKKTDIQVSIENRFFNQFFGISIVVMLMIGFIFIPGSAVYFIVNEKHVKTKHQQLVSGISVYAYYIGTFIGDMIISIPALLILFIFLLFMPGTDSLRGDAYFPSLITAILFILSSLPFVYCVGLLFTKPTTAVTFSSMFIFCGMMILLIDVVIGELGSAQMSSGFKVFFKCLSGSYCAGQTLLNYQIKLNFDSSLFDNYYSWTASGQSWCIMICQLFVYFGILFLSEHLQSIHQLSFKLGFTIDERDNDNDDVPEQDDDVVNEETRLKENDNDDIIKICGLRKVYKNKPQNNIAVKNMWFGVGKSEIFGFLGTNGAGKTTTLSMLTGAIFPSSGNAFVNGISIYNQNELRKYIGYAAQNDTLFDMLTGIEHLRFYGLLKGLNGHVLDEQIDVLLSKLCLNEYKDQRTSQYSGGNKRKLSVAISMIGNPPIIMLDEPSTGIDPSSRRNMQQFILNTMKGRSIILTTHSMEECEALSNRIGIMVKSELKCLGSTQHLKSKFGKGFQITIIIKNNNKTDNDDVVKEINEYLNKYFDSEIIDRHNLSLTIKLQEKAKEEHENKHDDDDDDANTLNLSKIFQIMEEMKQSLQIQSYGVSQPKLERIFLMMAKRDDDDDVEDNEKN